MANNKKKQDEKHLKMLRDMVTFPGNKQCFDCSQRGPTYVNMTIGSFVCTSCSGVLRGLNPPYRVKSISMTSFTPEEMDFLKSHGNELNRKIYLGLHDSQSWPTPDSRDEQKVRDYMVEKYERKRWYVAPTEAMKEEAKWTNEAALNNKPQVKPLRSHLGENTNKMPVGTGQFTPSSHAPVQVSVPLPGDLKSPPFNNQNQVTSTMATSNASSGFDLFGDLGGDPFASNASANGNAGGFADFSNFGSTSSGPSHHPTFPAAQSAFVPQAFPVSSTPLQPSAKGQTTTPTMPQKPPAQSFSSGGDKYAALLDLTSAFSAPVTTTATMNWGGTDGGAINWGGTSSTAGTPSHGTGGAIYWNSQGSAISNMGTTGSSVGFGAPSAVNPFGGVSSTGLTQFPGVSATSSVNPFGGSPAMTPFAQATNPANAGFGSQFVAGGQGGGYGQFPAMQNGGFGMASTTGGYGVPGSYTQQQFMPTQTGGVAAQSGGWSQFGSVPVSQPMSNPFMSNAIHQQVPPTRGSTNPFL